MISMTVMAFLSLVLAINFVFPRMCHTPVLGAEHINVEGCSIIAGICQDC